MTDRPDLVIVDDPWPPNPAAPPAAVIRAPASWPVSNPGWQTDAWSTASVITARMRAADRWRATGPLRQTETGLELDLERWEDDGGPAGTTLLPLVVEIRPDLEAFRAAWRSLIDTVTRIGQACLDTWRSLAGFLNAFRAVTRGRTADRMRAAGRWHTDVPPRRWRDWQPSLERPADRARRQRLERQLRRRARKAARRASRQPAPIALRDARVRLAEERLGLAVQRPGAGLVLSSVTA